MRRSSCTHVARFHAKLFRARSEFGDAECRRDVLDEVAADIADECGDATGRVDDAGIEAAVDKGGPLADRIDDTAGGDVPDPVRSGLRFE